MRLLTHNQLQCIRRGCTKQYPLTLQARQVELESTTCNPAFIAHLMINVDYATLYSGASILGVHAALPLPDAPLPNFVQLASMYARRAQESFSDDDDEEEEEEETDNTDCKNDALRKSDDKSTRSSLPATSTPLDVLSMSEIASIDDDHAELLQILHTVLMDTHIQEGELICPGCSRQYMIQQGIPNMRLNEDEV